MVASADEGHVRQGQPLVLHTGAEANTRRCGLRLSENDVKIVVLIKGFADDCQMNDTELIIADQHVHCPGLKAGDMDKVLLRLQMAEALNQTLVGRLPFNMANRLVEPFGSTMVPSVLPTALLSLRDARTYVMS